MNSFNEAYEVVDKTFEILGLKNVHRDEKDEPKIHYKMHRIIYLLGFLNLIMLLFGEAMSIKIYIHHILENPDDFIEYFGYIAEVTPCFIVSSISAHKTVTLVYKRKQVKSLFKKMQKLWPTTDDPECIAIRKNIMEPTIKYCWAYTFVSNGLSTVYNIFPVIIMLYFFIVQGHSDKYLPYFVWYAWDWQNNWFNFVLTILSQFHGGIFTTACVSGADCLFCIMVAQLSMQFQLLCKYLTQISFDKENLGEQSAEHKLKQAIEYHIKLIRIHEDIESIYTFTLLTNLVASSLMICISGFSITISPPDRIVKYTMFLASNLSQIWLISNNGNKLIEATDLISRAAYEGQWVGADIKHMRTISIIQHRGLYPLKISVMGFTSISLATFTSILSTSWSYFTLIRTIFADREV